MKNLEAAIAEITVYPESARVLRRGQLYLTAGQHLLVFDGLPATLDEDSVGVSGKGETVRVLDVDLHAQFVPRLADSDFSELETRLHKLVEEDTRLADEEAVEEARIHFWESLREASSHNLGRALAFGRANMGIINEFTAQMADALRAIYERRRTLQQQRDTLEREIKKCETRLPSHRRVQRRARTEPSVATPREDKEESFENFEGAIPRSPFLSTREVPRTSAVGSRLTGSAARQPGLAVSSTQTPPAVSRRFSLKVFVEAKCDTELTLEITYVVNNVSWLPVYDVRLNNNNHLTLNYQALVRQRTGEDWLDVPLLVSTSRPVSTATLPQLRPWYIDRQGPRIAQFPPRSRAFGRFEAGFVARASHSAETGRSGGHGEPVRDALDSFDHDLTDSPSHPEIEATRPAVTYPTFRPVAIRSNDVPIKAAIATLDLAIDLDYVTIPKLAEEVYLRAKVNNISDYTLLNGAAHVFRDADYVGKTEVTTTAHGESLALQLGVDDRIKVKRQLLEKTTSHGRAHNMQRTQFVYLITLHNHLASSVHLTVYDQLPVSRHEDIKINLLEITPEPAEQDPTGIIRWEVILESGESRACRMAFALEYPNTMNLYGFS